YCLCTKLHPVGTLNAKHHSGARCFFRFCRRRLLRGATMNRWMVGVIALMLFSLAPAARAGTVTIIEPTEGGIFWTLIVTGIPTGGPGGNGTFVVPGTAESVSIVYASNRVTANSTTVVGVLFDNPQFTQISDILTFST